MEAACHANDAARAVKQRRNHGWQVSSACSTHCSTEPYGSNVTLLSQCAGVRANCDTASRARQLLPPRNTCVRNTRCSATQCRSCAGRSCRPDRARRRRLQCSEGTLQRDLVRVADITDGEGRVEVDPADPYGQTLLICFPTVETTADGMPDAYVRPVVRIESGAKSAIDPHRLVSIRRCVAEDVPNFVLDHHRVTTIEPARTFWEDCDRAWAQALVRAARHITSGRAAYLSALLRPALSRPLGHRPSSNHQSCAWCGLRATHAPLFDRPDDPLASGRPGSFAR